MSGSEFYSSAEYPQCCSVVNFMDFNDPDEGGVDLLSDEQMAKLEQKMVDTIDTVKRNGYYTMIMAVLVRRQEQIVPLFQKLGFYQSPKYMKKSGLKKLGPAHNDTILFFLPCGLEVD